MNAPDERARLGESAGASTLIDTIYPTTDRTSGDLPHESARLGVVSYKRRPAIADAARFLTLLDETATRFTFQTFDDNRDRADPKLARILHGTLAEHAETLTRLNNLVQLHRSLFAMHCPCDNGDYETPNVCWSAVEHATTASGERPSLTRRLRVTTLPDPACQREQPTSLPGRGAPRMYGTNRAQHDSCVQSRHDDLLASQIASPQSSATG
jgi:hypothetical protein